MTEGFLKLLNRSLCAGWLVLAVLVLRLVLKKAPKWIRCLLWAMVAVRLICPFSFESVLSLIPSAETVPREIIYAAVPAIDSGVKSIDHVVNATVMNILIPEPAASVNPIQIWLAVGAWVWLAGIAAMVIYALVSYVRVCRKSAPSVNLGNGVYLCDYISSPFILGIMRPKIYLPSTLTSGEADHVLAHERAHLKRRDHWWKPLGYLLLTVYWFHPLMWVAYWLLCRDIELACDERVIRDMDVSGKKAYSETLLNCSLQKHTIAACPLAFGEAGVKERVKTVLNYKKPAFWVLVVAIAVCAVTAVCFLTDPIQEESGQSSNVLATVPVDTQWEEDALQAAVEESLNELRNMGEDTTASIVVLDPSGNILAMASTGETN